MSRELIWKCNCRCGASAASKSERRSWLKLLQKKPDESGNEAKLDGELHFASIDCLKNWARRASAELKELQTVASTMPRVRGMMRSEKAQGLYI